MDWEVKDGCRRLLGITSQGKRVVCGKPSAVRWDCLCSQHAEVATPATLTFQLDSSTAEKLAARATAYGISTNELLSKLVRAGVALNLDCPQ